MLKTIAHNAKFKNGVICTFEWISKSDPQLYKFLYEASNHGSIFIIGGFLRSVANTEKPRDLDVVFNLSDDWLKQYISRKNLITRRNRFNGYKINFHTLTVDVWASESSWAFTEKVVSVGQRDIISSLAQSTFFNYDSLVFDLRTQKINVTGYNDCVRLQTLDIMRKNEFYAKRNPGSIGNIIRAFKIRQSTGLNFSLPLCRYIFDMFLALNLYDLNKVNDYLLYFVSTKSSDKYNVLQDRFVLQELIQYVMQVLENDRQETKAQLSLFHNESRYLIS